MSPAQSDDLLSGRYRLRTVIGRGGMGVVWLAGDELLHRAVAVKETIWPAHLNETEQAKLRQRALREARTAAGLDHPNIVKVFDVVEDDGRPWMVMQLVPFRSLSDIVRGSGPLSAAQTAQIGLHLLDAIQAAHAAGVLHRDVKPGNVLLGPDDRVVLTDFGLAVGDSGPTLTTAGLLMGSPAYMAPERARGEKAGPAADLWSLGATLYVAVEGREPFRRNGTMAVLTAIVTDEPDEPERAGPLWPVISGLLRKDPRARLDAAGAERLLGNVADKATAGDARLPATLTLPLTTADLAAQGEDVTFELKPVGLAEDVESSAAAVAAAPAEAEAAEAAEAAGAAAVVAESAAAREPAEAAVAGKAAAEVADGPASSDAAAASEAPPSSAAAGAASAAFDDRQHDDEGRSRPPLIRVRPDSGGEEGRSLDGDDSVVASGRRRRGAMVTAAALGLTVVAALAFWLVHSVGSQPPAAAAGGSTTPSSAGRPGSNASPNTTPASGSRHSASAAPGSSGSASGALAPAVLPAGYVRYADPTGFSIGIPAGWQVSHSGGLVYFRPPAGGMFLFIQQTTRPQSNALADWKQQAAARVGTYPGYHQIRIQSVSYAEAEQAAAWEFTYNLDGVPTHVLNLNVLVNSHQAYALYWSAPQSQWAASYHYFTEFMASFRPASAPATAVSGS